MKERMATKDIASLTVQKPEEKVKKPRFGASRKLMMVFITGSE
jgi:hypothetical protein